MFIISETMGSPVSFLGLKQKLYTVGLKTLEVIGGGSGLEAPP
jgi:hypothetical protein